MVSVQIFMIVIPVYTTEDNHNYPCNRNRNGSSNRICTGRASAWRLHLFTNYSVLLPPANEVWGKVIFLHLSVILFTGGVPGQVPPRQVHPSRQLPPVTPLGRYTAPSRYTPAPDRYTLLGRYIPLGRYTPSRPGTPSAPRQVHLRTGTPYWAGTPPGYKWMVRILLKCILVVDNSERRRDKSFQIS